MHCPTIKYQLQDLPKILFDAFETVIAQRRLNRFELYGNDILGKIYIAVTNKFKFADTSRFYLIFSWRNRPEYRAKPTSKVQNAFIEDDKYHVNYTISTRHRMSTKIMPFLHVFCR